MYKVFEQLLEEKNVSTADVARATGISKSTFSSWKNGTTVPKADKLFLIAQYFGVPMELFFETDEEKRRAIWYEALHKRYDAEYHATITPIFECAAGQGRINGDYAEEYKEEEMQDSEEFVWSKVCGDSMYPELMDGDLIKVHLQTETTPHDLTVIKVNGDEATVKYVEITDKGVWLRAINKEVFEDRFFTVQEVMTLPITIIGKVVMFQRNYV